ncbi:hypothetical protein DFO67_105297, partial [Modicisalibacter xianhensis]
ITNEFFIPFVNLRDNKKGYAVSLIKAGAEIIGKPAGSVRAPLTMPSEQEVATLKRLVEKAETL